MPWEAGEEVFFRMITPGCCSNVCPAYVFQEAVVPEKDREDPLDEYQEDQEQEIV